MKKSEIKLLFGGSEKKMSEKLNRSQPAVNQWDEDLTLDRKIFVIGSAAIFGIEIPNKWLKQVRAELEKKAS